ncbi:MAG: PEP-CTERM sorting domain-containing protein [Deltaproteobacteria bacterium]|nr:PEP-CTERM sorting domain-containing protein [Deltaproteobacteria bacterium]
MVDGSEMAGMKVTATYLVGTEVATWEATIDDAGHAVGSYVDPIFGITWREFELSLDGDSFSMNWELENSGTVASYLTSLKIEALPGNVVFDVDGEHREDPPSTPGSMYGLEFALTGAIDGYDGEVTATYSDQVALNGTVYGDLYGTLTLGFDPGLFGVLSPWSSFSQGITFKADTDIVVPVPEPGTLLLLGLGVLGLLGYAKKRK